MFALQDKVDDVADQLTIFLKTFINERNVIGIMEELQLAQFHLERNVNAKVVLFDFALKMIVLITSSK